jgi:hypothetical protein
MGIPSLLIGIHYTHGKYNCQSLKHRGGAVQNYGKVASFRATSPDSGAEYEEEIPKNNKEETYADQS